MFSDSINCCIIKVESVDFLEEKIVYDLPYISGDFSDLCQIYNGYIVQLRDGAKEYLLYKFKKGKKISDFLRDKYFGAMNMNMSLILKCLRVIKKNNLDLPENLIKSPRINKFT
tara:strand:- start:135 stop:476 length:342 start_codon:yes stop_codon:yes gene_type:complete